MGPELLPGEHVELRLRPSPWAATGAYLRALAFAAYGGLLWILYTSTWWADQEAGPWYRFWTYLYGNAAVGHIYMAIGLVVGTVLFGMAMRRTWWAAGLLGLGVALAVVTTSVGLDPTAYTRTLPLLLGVAGLVALAIVEADRRLRAILFTNIRCVARGGLWERQVRFVRYEDVADVDVRQGPLGLALGFGDLVPVLQKHAGETEAPAITGIRPVQAGQDLLAAMVQRSTSTPQMQKANRMQARMDDAVRRLGARRA